MAETRIPSSREAVILSILVNGRKYGREIRNEYEKQAGRRMPLGSLYTTLSRMEQCGFVWSWLGESCHWRGGNRRKYFEMKGAGQQALDSFQRFLADASGGTLTNV